MVNAPPAEFDLDVLDVAAPCHANWADMEGDEQVRHCGLCEKNVYNVSEMTKAEATELILKNEGRLCVRFFRRSDGTVLTQDCPVGVRALHRRLLRAAVGVGLAVCLLIAAPLFAASRGMRRRVFGDSTPFAKLRVWNSPPPQKASANGPACNTNQMILGKVAPLVTPPVQGLMMPVPPLKPPTSANPANTNPANN